MKYFLLTSLAVFPLVSCSTKNPYDTPGVAASQPAAPNAPPAYSDSIYSSPPAYGDGAGTPPASSIAPASPVSPIPPAIATAPPDYQVNPPSAAPSPANPPLASGLTHTVVKGDTLSGIATKYKVPMASIKAANHMTTDTVVLGRKLIIPAR